MIKEFIKNYLGLNKQPVNKIKEEKAELEEAIKPLFFEIAPENKTDEYIDTLTSWSFIAISAIADEVSNTKLKLIKETANGIEEIENNPVISLIEKPNSVQTGSMLLWTITLYLLAAGEAPLLLDNSKNPTSMILLRPDRLDIIFGEDKIIEGYKYQKSDGSRITYKEDEIVFLRLPNKDTIFRGQGILKFIARTIDLDEYNERFMNNFFFNNATPGFVLKTDQQLNKSIIERLRVQFERRHRGVRNAWKMAVLEKGLTPEKIGSSLNDVLADKVEAKIRDKILAAFKVPKSVLGIVEDTNRANTEASDYIFAKRAILPKIEFLVDQLNLFLLPKFNLDKNFKLIYDNPVKEDDKINSDINVAYINAGVFTVNEVREKLGYDPIDEQEIQEDNEQATGDSDGTPEEDDLEKSIKSFLLEGEITKKNWTREELEKHWKTKTAFTDQEEKEVKRKMENYFKHLQGQVIVQVKNQKAIETMTTETEDLKINIGYDPEEESQVIAGLIAPSIGKAIVKQSKLAYILLGLDDFIPDKDELVKKFVIDRATRVGKEISDTSQKSINRILKTWAKKDENLLQLKTRLYDYFGKAQKNRVDNIARTEMSRASGWADLEVYKRIGAVGKQWITVKDERTCQFCKPMDGKIIPINKNFWNRNDSMVGLKLGKISFGLESVPNYPLHNRCRCVLVPIFEKSEIPKNWDSYKRASERRALKLDAKKEIKKKKEIEKARIKIKESELKEKEIKLEKKEKKLKKDIKDFEKTINE